MAAPKYKMATSSFNKELLFAIEIHAMNKPKADRTVITVADIPFMMNDFNSFKTFVMQKLDLPVDEYSIILALANDQALLIDGQSAFVVALEVFRLRSRLNDSILLKIVYDPTKKDVFATESRTKITTFNNHACKNAFKKPHSLHTLLTEVSEAPEWFQHGLQKLKSELGEELSNRIQHMFVSSSLSSSGNHKRLKLTNDSSLQAYRHCNAHEFKDQRLVEKLERKVERKAFRENQLCKPISKSKPIDKFTQVNHMGMGAKCVADNGNVLGEKSHTKYLHGGTQHTHKWTVKNVGSLPWNDQTKVLYTWGSETLKVLSKELKVPKLLPNEIGTIEATFQIPDELGVYESYWSFFHMSTRFGDSLMFKANVIMPPTFPAPNTNEALKWSNCKPNKHGKRMVCYCQTLGSLSCNICREPVDVSHKTSSKIDKVTQFGDTFKEKESISACSKIHTNTSFGLDQDDEELLSIDVESKLVLDDKASDEPKDFKINMKADTEKKDLPKPECATIVESSSTKPLLNVDTSPLLNGNSRSQVKFGVFSQPGSNTNLSEFSENYDIMSAVDHTNISAEEATVFNDHPHGATPLTFSDFCFILPEYSSQLWHPPNLEPVPLAEASMDSACSLPPLEPIQRVFVFPASAPGFEIPLQGSNSSASSEPSTSGIQSGALSKNQNENMSSTNASSKTDAATSTCYVHSEVGPNANSSNSLKMEDVLKPFTTVTNSAIQTAQTVINSMKKSPERDPQSTSRTRPTIRHPLTDAHLLDPVVISARESNLRFLNDMGFCNVDTNAKLLDRYFNDLNQVVSVLLR